MTTEKQPIDGYCIVELMGHARMVGRVTEEEHGGCIMFRIDQIIPDDPDNYVTCFFPGGNNIYRMTQCTEDVAKAMATIDPRPRRPMEFRPAPQLEAPSMDETDNEIPF